MRGFSSSFPRHSAGAGLLLLRAAVGLQLLFESGCAGTPAWWLAALVWTLAAMLALGLLTPVVSGLSAAFQLFCLTHAGGAHAIGLLIAAATAGALLLLGPGAYAVDARLFGRRRLMLPATSRERDNF